ncbi:MAG TPA: hypothetical protein VM694_21005, partial [Polyangium sp.]|nr:hypothetical protein [Polyangium sp.]
GSGYFFVRSRRAPKEAVTRDPEALVALGAAVFAFGLAAWLGARGMAYDARHLVPAPEAHDVYCTGWGGPPASSLPPAGPCDPGVRAPTLTLDVEEGLYLDHKRVKLAKLGEALRNERKRDGDTSEDPVLLVGAPADTPMATLLPILAAVEKDFGGQIALLRARPEQSLSTATLGEVSMQRRCCSHRLRMAPNGTPLSTYTTWGDVARAMSEGAFFRLDP